LKPNSLTADAGLAAQTDFGAPFPDLRASGGTLPSSAIAPSSQTLPAIAPSSGADAALPSSGLIAVRFNLADPFAPQANENGPIEVSKAVKVNGADAGSATIRITEGATIAISSEDLGHLLGSAGRGDLAASLGSGFVTFDRIRRAGLEVHYDATSDRILLSS
jgi:hypothetical protein